jgi:hypothetical protein
VGEVAAGEATPAKEPPLPTRRGGLVGAAKEKAEPGPKDIVEWSC